MPPDSAAPVSPADRFFEFALLGLLASAFLAVVGSGYLDTPTTVITAMALIVRALIAAGLLRLELPPGVVTVVTLAYVGFYPVDYFFISESFIPSAVHLVFFVAVVKILTGHTNRDYLFLKVIAFLELLAACILSSRVNFFGFLLLFLVLGVATFASGEIRQSAHQRGAVAKFSGRGLWARLTVGSLFISVAILAITAGLFFFLPRTARAAFQHLVSRRDRLTGFSTRVTLGEIGELKRDNTPVMHIKMDHPEDRNLPLKWRGAALSEFDGRTWFVPPSTPQILRPDQAGLLVLEPAPPRRSEVRHISYAVHLGEMSGDALFFAGTPQYLRIDSLVFRNSLDNFRVRLSDAHNIWYQVYSRLELPSPDLDTANEFVEPLTREWRGIYLQLPRTDPRVGELAHEITRGELSPFVQARLVEKYLRTRYGYTLELPQFEPADPLAYFLFHRKKGHCEYFASSMAVMLRLLGIPSRVVTGFQSGVYNPISGSQLIRSSDAHSWVEAWLPHRGWTTFDPTPADPNALRLSVWTRLGFYADAAEVFWQDWVLNYNLDRQLQLASRVGESSRHVGLNWFDGVGPALSQGYRRTSSFVLRYGAVLFGMAIAAIMVQLFGRDWWRWWKSRQQVLKVQRGEAEASDATLLYHRMLKVLRKRGIEKPAWVTPSEFARVLQEPVISKLVLELTAAYNELRFGGNTEVAGRIVSLLEQLEAVS
ncbi:MAG TPA: transglutaminaseTgpA domain-containing protein [Bryobacteraceae bacterium]|jgi:transglutaminase-like putative cysteine protease|nr:transglutaminaseTgpA domain-containing protein [Bryobacteraceae bacterium]